VADAQAVESDDYLTAVDDGDTPSPSTSTSCDSSSLSPLSSHCSVSDFSTHLFNMANGGNCTIINDELTCNSLINSNRHTAAELCLIPVNNGCNIRQDAPSDYLTPTEHAGIMAHCLHNDNYLLITDDTGTSCQPNTEQVSATTEQAKESLKSAGDDSDDYLVIFGESSHDFTARASDMII
jgi:hypothetical protein